MKITVVWRLVLDNSWGEREALEAMSDEALLEYIQDDMDITTLLYDAVGSVERAPE